MAKNFISSLDLEEINAKKADDAAAAALLGKVAPSHIATALPPPENAAIIIATNVASNVPRERVYDDSEAKIVQGRLWLISFTDLFSIMLCFFLMLFSMKDPDEARFKRLNPFLLSGMHSGDGVGQAGTQQGRNIAQVTYGEGLDLSYLQGVLKNMLNQVKLDKDVDIVVAKDHLKLVMAGSGMFTGNALSEDGKRIAKTLAGRLMTLSNRLTIVAIPEDSQDWAGSAAKAGAFATVLQDSGYRKSYTVIGEGEGKRPGIEIRVEADDGQLR